MNIIIRAFSPESGNVRATCADICNNAVGLIVKGDDADALVAKFHAQAPTIDLSSNWSGLSDLFESLETDSPIIMFCRNTREEAEQYRWMDCFHKNLGKNPDNEAEMVGIVANVKFDRPEVVSVASNIINARFSSNRGVVLIASTPYDKQRDFEPLTRVLERAYASLCYEKPEEHWAEVEELLHNELGKDNGYILIVDAEGCSKRSIWNVALGEPTNHRLKIDWKKRGWSIGQDYNEHTSEIVNARTGVISYESFQGCITEITDDAMTIKLGDRTETLTPGSSLVFRDGDSYEDHEGVEHYDISYALEIEWLKE